MSSRNKKQRHKAKRDAKKREARRKDSISPIKRLADAKGEIECWKTGDFESLRQISFFVYKRGGGLNGLACFLVDRGVVGLKDAYVRLRVERAELEYMLSAGKSQGIVAARCTVDEVRKTVAAGIRFAHDNGMRLPKDWVKTASIIGGVGDWASADVSAFSREFMGHPQDLRRRLIGEPFDEYIQQNDITFLFADDAPLMDLDTGEYEGVDQTFDEIEGFDEQDIAEEEIEKINEYVAPLAIELAEKTRQWVAARRQTPAFQLTEAWQSMMVAMMLARVTLPDGTPEATQQIAGEFLEEMADEVDPSQWEEYEKSYSQVLEHVQSDPGLVPNAVDKYAPAEPSRRD